jgi:hypothetical protein
VADEKNDLIVLCKIWVIYNSFPVFRFGALSIVEEDEITGLQINLVLVQTSCILGME